MARSKLGCINRRFKRFFRQHVLQDIFQRHSMAAQTPLRKETAGAVPFTIVIAYIVFVIFTVEFGGKPGKGNPFLFLSISFGFFNLSY